MEYTSKHRSLKPLPEFGIVIVSLDIQQCIDVQLQLFKQFPKAHWPSGDNIKPGVIFIPTVIDYGVQHYYIYWRNNKGIFYSEYEPMHASLSTPMEFDDYFELKPEFRGHNLKAYGI